jgi:hypothetical protein
LACPDAQATLHARLAARFSQPLVASLPAEPAIKSTARITDRLYICQYLGNTKRSEQPCATRLAYWVPVPMPIPDYLETLARFDLEKLKAGADLCLDANGDIAITRDGYLQMGNTTVNAMFRLVEKWRATHETAMVLFAEISKANNLTATMVEAAQHQLVLSQTRQYLEAQEQIGAVKEVSATLAGTVFVTLNNTLQRFRKDIAASSQAWESRGPLVHGRSIGAIASAASANFRHYDEWAATPVPTRQQLESMEVICGVICCDAVDHRGHRTLRTNVCDQLLAAVCGGSLEALDDRTFEFCKAIADF